MLTKWKIITALGLAAAGAVASGIAVLLQKLPPEEAAPAGDTKTGPKNLVTGSYSFISGFQDAATVEVCLDYDPEAFSFVVVEDEFLNYSSASHAAIVCGRDFNLQLVGGFSIDTYKRIFNTEELNILENPNTPGNLFFCSSKEAKNTD